MKKKFLKQVPVLSFLTAMSVTAPLLFNACKPQWVFINNTVGISFFTTALLFLMIAAAVINTVLLAVKIYREKSSFCKSKGFSALSAVSLTLTSVLFIFAVIYSAGIAFTESSEVFQLYLKDTLSKAALIIPPSFLCIFLPAMSCKAKRIICIISLVAVSVFAVNDFFPLSPYKITCPPTVYDNGNQYSVVFSTNDNGTGYIEYTYEGESYKVYDNIGGRIRSDSKIHSVSVPYEHLRNNSYKVGSVRVIEDYSYGSRLGKEITSEEYTLTCNDTYNQTYLVISDWHTMLDKAYTAIGNLNADYDAVIMLGDATPGVDFEEQVVSNIVEFGGEVSKGTRPVLYVRGNHETRGTYASDIPEALGLDEFYYTADIGPYSFVVLDSGEDKDDSHSEYGGMTDYNTYRKDMIEWLKGAETENERVIVLSHAWQISTVEEELSDEGWKQLDRLGARIILSGHIHQCRFLGDGSDREKKIFSEYPDIIGYADGGKTKIGDDYIASLMTLTKDGISIRAVDNLGEEKVNESFEW